MLTWLLWQWIPSRWVSRKGWVREQCRCTPNKNQPTYPSVPLSCPALAVQDLNMSHSEWLWLTQHTKGSQVVSHSPKEQSQRVQHWMYMFLCNPGGPPKVNHRSGVWNKTAKLLLSQAAQSTELSIKGRVSTRIIWKPSWGPMFLLKPRDGNSGFLSVLLKVTGA